MDPTIIKALITAGASLLQGIFGGVAKSQELKWQQKLLEQQRQWKQEDLQKALALLRPTVPLFEPPTLPALNYAVQKAVLGNLQTRLGQELLDKWGLNLADILEKTRLSLPFSESPWGRQQGSIISNLLNQFRTPQTGTNYPILREFLDKGRIRFPEY